MKRALVPTVIVAGALLASVVTPAVATEPAAPRTVQVRAAAISAAAPASRPGPSWQPSFRGKLLKVRHLHDAAALSGARNYKLWYLSVGARGEPITVTGTLAVPKGHAPRHGWPVMSWAHGTTGVADVCAPSRDTVDGPAHGYLSVVDQTLDKWVAAGYAVVQTDYEGLGTPGLHTYINGTSEANTVVDMVRAAREFNGNLRRQWIAAGHSEGGQAALFAAAQPRGRHDVQLLGSIALAPGGYGISQIPHYVVTPGPAQQYALAFLPTTMIGAAAADPAVDLQQLLTTNGWKFFGVAFDECQDQIGAASATVDPNDVIKPGADLTAMTSYLLAQEPQFLKLTVPTLVLQGTADAAVNPAFTDIVVQDLRANSSVHIGYRKYEGADHRGVLAASIDAQLGFARALYRHQRHHR